MNETQERALPAPALAKRDSDGRLVGVAINGHQPFPSAEDNTWLVAIDGSVHSLRATAQAARWPV